MWLNIRNYLRNMVLTDREWWKFDAAKLFERETQSGALSYLFANERRRLGQADNWVMLFAGADD